MAVDPLHALDHDQLVSLVRETAKQNVKLRKLFLDSDSPAIQQAAKEAPELLLLDVADRDVATLRKSYFDRQADFDTAPFDEGGAKFRMFPGGVTIWSGFPGSGKTTILRQLACHLLSRGRGVFIASLEERPDDMLFRLMQTAAGDLNPSEAQCKAFIDLYAERLRLWGMIGLAPVASLIGAIRVTARQGVRHAIVDSLTCLDVGGSDWDGQRGFANELVALARTENVHVHLVAHPRKPSVKDTGPDLADVAGSSDLVRLVDNVVFIRRATDNESQNFSDATPMLAVIRKQRHGTGMCGDIQGWFHRAHVQFSHSQWWEGPTEYLNGCSKAEPGSGTSDGGVDFDDPIPF